MTIFAWHRNMNFATCAVLMYDVYGCLARAAVQQKEAREGGQVDMNLTSESSPYRVVPNGTSQRVSCHKKKRRRQV
jgi:hypothetical protein